MSSSWVASESVMVICLMRSLFCRVDGYLINIYHAMGKFSTADSKLMVFFLFFPENRIWHFMQIVGRQFAWSVKSFFLGKLRKNNIKCHLLKFLPGMQIVMLMWAFADFIFLGPVVQSVVSLTSSLRVISLTDLADSIYNFLICISNEYPQHMLYKENQNKKPHKNIT